MRASAMLHLPGLVLSEQINQVIQAVNKIGLAVRGLYGEGTEALGNLFQISNQTTLGEKEDEIISRLSKVIETIIEKEQDARQMLIQKKSEHALGPDRPRLRRPDLCPRDDLEGSAESPLDHEARRRSRRVPGRPASADRRTLHRHAAGPSAKELAAEAQCRRARPSCAPQIIRDRLRVFPKPDISKVARESENGSTSEPQNNE